MFIYYFIHSYSYPYSLMMRNAIIDLKFIWRIIECALCLPMWLYFLFTCKKSDSSSCLVGKTAIVTGGSSGIGLAAATLLASRGCRVIIADKVVSEEAQKQIVEQTQNPNVILKHLDLASNKSIRKFAEDIKKSETKIDILINNAAIGGSCRKSSEDGNNYLMQVNYFGAFLLSHLLLEQLKASCGARIVFTGSVSSFTHSFSLDLLNVTDYEDDGSYNRILYSNSKLCNIIAAQGFAKRLNGKFGISVFSIDPGAARTPIYKHQGEELLGAWYKKLGFDSKLLCGTDTLTAAQSAFHVTTQSTSKLQNGEHYYQCRPFTKPWICYDRKICDEVWRKTEEVVQLKPEEKIDSKL